MTRCTFSPELLLALADGEVHKRAAEAAAHVRGCAQCRLEVAALQESAAALRETVDRAIGEVDVERAAVQIRARVEAAQQRSVWHKLALGWQELWAFHRRSAAGVALAMALGALSAPVVVLWAARHSGSELAGVVIESIEWENDARAVVYRFDGGATTLIWMEPNHDDATAPHAPTRSH